MKKIIVSVFLISLLLISLLLLVACAPQITDEELEVELAKLTPEEREALLKDIEEKEKNPLAGQAVAQKYGISSKVGLASSKQIQAAMKKLTTPVPSCKDSDGGIDYTVGGKVTNEFSENYVDHSTPDGNLLEEYYCERGQVKSKLINCKFDTGFGESSHIYSGGGTTFCTCDKNEEGCLQAQRQCFDDDQVGDPFVKGSAMVQAKSLLSGKITTEQILIDKCNDYYGSVQGVYCYNTEDPTTPPSIIFGLEGEGDIGYVCPNGCSNGACCPESGCPPVQSVQQSQGTPQIVQN